MMKKIMQALLAVSLISGVTIASTQDAEAHRRGYGVAAGVAAGIIGLGILGAYSRPAYGYGRACYRGPERCGYVGRRCWVNRWGEEVCRRGEYRCWRPRYCD